MPDIIRQPPDSTFTGPNSSSNSSTNTTINGNRPPITISTSNGSVEPIHVKNYGGSSYGQSERLNDDCGNSEVEQNGATGYQISMEGLLSADQVTKTEQIGLTKGENVVIDLPIWTREYIVGTFDFDKPNDLNKYYSPQYLNGVQAYTFKLQTKDPTQNSGSP